MSFERYALAVFAVMSMAVNVWLWSENNVLRQRLSTTVTDSQLAAVAGACESLVSVNRRCLAFGQHVKEMINGQGDEVVARQRWAKFWDDEVLSGPGGADKTGAGGP